MKVCADCKIEKEVSEFGKRAKNPDGLYNYCKECKRTADKLHYEKNREAKIKKQQAYYEANRENILKERSESGKNSIRAKKWREENYEYHLASKVEYRKNNKEKIAKENKEYKAKNKESIRKTEKEYRKNNPDILNPIKKKFNSKPLEKIKNRVRKRVWEVLKRNSAVRSKKFEEYIGCSQEELKNHIVSLFTDGMTWDLLIDGKIHIDHIKPLAHATTAEEIYALCHYLNLQPLWATDNLKKNKY